MNSSMIDTHSSPRANYFRFQYLGPNEAQRITDGHGPWHDP